ncbi:MAG: hypothetical protein A2289_19250 [Deltaproteobacteria bacterium RIFOXYA12_FULL_58_15]|nr:MAG: hypothetical protein A2289_19250 [Deltaproteobacteria bacterium RIFOXYA12_FULL_58_15]OGR10695.1 MAG: hypothetical protein A2341_10075 [Deltaproteobacteria bacterium RIFOXYB12_FULL_58_9]
MTQPTSDNGLLAGTRVVELGQSIAAPLVGMLLAEQGAEVVRVVFGSSTDPVLDGMLARGKSEVVVDLQQPEGRAVLLQLLGRADVVVENLPPGILSRAQLDFDRIREHANPRLVSCSLREFPLGDPRGGGPHNEAAAGMAGFLYEKPLGKPLYHDFPIGSVMSALYAVNGVVAALIARFRTGRGQHVDTSQYQANLCAQVLQVFVKAGVPRGFLPLKMAGTPFMSVWRCRDERWVYLHVTLPAHNTRILEILEGEGFVEEVERLRSIMSEETLRDPSQVTSIPEAKKIRKVYEKIFLTRTADEWEEVLAREICCIKVRTIDEWLTDSAEAGMTDACIVDDPVFGELNAPGPGVACAEYPPLVVPRVQVESGEIIDRWSEREIPVCTGGPQPLRHPLEGIRVLDLSRIIAGPCAARVLAELGADVLSVQSLTKLDWALSFHLVFNAGKRSMTLDFSDDAGKAQLNSIIDSFRPDAFIQNYRNLDLARVIGIDPDTLHRRYPELVCTHLNAYGNEGGWRDRPGFEQVVQAVTGIQVAYARGGRPKLLPSPIIDIGSGLLGAFATLLGLYRQVQNKEGTFVATHLTSVAVLFQIHRIAASQRQALIARAIERGISVDDDPGRRQLADVVKTKGGYVCVAGPADDLRRWLDAAGVHAAMTCSPEELLTHARPYFGKHRLEALRSAVVRAGFGRTVSLVENRSVRHIVEDVRRLDRGPIPMVYRRKYPGIDQELTFVRNPLAFSMTPIVDIETPPMRGAHTRAVLSAIGEPVPEGDGIVPYPTNKPLLLWLVSFARWGYYAWKSGNI